MTSGASQEQNKETVLAFYRHLERGDAEAAFSLFTDDGIWFSPSFRVETPAADHGPKIAAFIGHMKNGITFEFGDFTVDDDRVAVTMSGHASLVNGAEYNQLYHMLFKFRGGKIAYVAEYCDTQHTREALAGLVDFSSGVGNFRED